jgi:hypothetical protein
MRFTISSKFLEHTGQTKFYQPFFIRCDSGKVQGCGVGHYGPNKALSGLDKRPINGGQCKVYSVLKMEEVVNDKTKRKTAGWYDFAKDGPDLSLSESDFSTWLSATFPTKVREEIRAFMGLTVSGAVSIAPEPASPGDEPETISHAPGEEPEGWGGW